MCSRPSCAAPAAATLRFCYATREAVMDVLETIQRPQTYDLCGLHATRTRPPHGWTLQDLRGDGPNADEVAAPSPTGLPEPDTVALLAAALHAAADGGPRRTAGSARSR